MIFKTFNNDIDKISAKWGIFGKSFNDIGTAISGKISDINKNFQATDDLIGSIKNSGDGIWARLYPTKEQIASLQINVPELIDTKKANEYLNIMNQIDAGIHPVLSSYQEWHDELADGEKWIAKYAQSTKGQIRSLESVNEANQSARASALAHNEALKQQTLGAKAATVAMKALSVVGNMLAMYAITKLITAYNDYKEKLHDIAEEMSAQAKKSSEYVDNLLDLKTQLEEGTKSSDELTSAFKDQLEAMGYTETEIDNLIEKYNGLSGAIDEATRKALENAKTDAYADVASASKALEIDSDGGLFTDILIGDYKTGLEQLDSEIEKILSDVATKTAQQGRAWIAKDHSAEGLYEYYNALKDVSRLIQETASETNNNELLDLGNAFDPTVYGEVTEAINKLKDSAELYGEAISRLHNADAQLELSDYLKTNDINSQETFDNYINGIKDSTEYSESYKQVLIDVANKAFPQFSQQAKNAAETLDNFGNKTDISFSDIFSLKDAENNLTDLGKINEEIDKFQSAYKGLKEAMDSYNETGTFTLDQVQEIISYGGDYLKYLMDENGNLQLNEEALNKVAIARINEMRAKALSNLMDNLDKITNEEQALNYLETQLFNTATAYDALTASRIKAWSENALENGISQETINKVTKSFKNQVSAINEMFNNISLDSIYKSSSSSAKSATKDAEQATKEYIDSYMDYMEQSLESGRIDYQTYSRDVAKFLKDMYDQGKIAAKDYHDYTKQMLTVQKNAMDSVISAVTNRLDKEIDFYEDQIDAVEKRYQTEIDYLDTVIEYYEDQKKAIQDTNDELDRQKALEEALYNLEKKQTQKTIGLYTANKGKIYTTDASAIREAEDDVRKAKLDIEIAKLDDAIEKVEQQQDALRDAMDKEKEQLQEIIDRLEEYKEQWQNVAKEYEIAQSEMMASQMLGADWESQILSGRIDTLNTFAQNYIAIQQAIAQAAWDSANEQIKAAQSAADAISRIDKTDSSSGGNHGYKAYIGNELIGVYNSKNEANDAAQKEVSNRAESEARKAAEKNGGKDATSIYNNTKMGVGSNLTNKIKIKPYASGTKNAKKGLNLVGENGIETYIDNDGNISLVTEPTLIPMEGGEIVKNESETKSLLDGSNLVPLQTSGLLEKLSANVPDLSSMIKVNTPDYSKLGEVISKSQIIEQHNQFNISLPNITDNTKATKLFEELQRLPLDALQYSTKRKK